MLMFGFWKIWGKMREKQNREEKQVEGKSKEFFFLKSINYFSMLL